MNIPLRYRIGRFIGHQRYISRGRDRLVRIITRPNTTPSVKFSVPFFGQRYSGDLDTYIEWSIYMYGAYAKNELLLLRDIATTLRSQRDQLSFFDVGANVGQHSLFMSPLVDKVFSFEPFPLVRDKIGPKIVENNINNIEIFPIGLGTDDAELEYSVPVGCNTGTGSFRGGSGGNEILRLPVRNGDNFFNEKRLPRIDILKVDVEGFESAVFQGLSAHLKRDRPIILTEIFGRDFSGFGTRDGFAKSLYDDCKIYSVRAKNISGGYRLSPISSDLDAEILVLPNELVDSLKHLF